jgi:ABC-type transport system involved in cytochrome bd biosynthesis fused ATPase/permease subunit
MTFFIISFALFLLILLVVVAVIVHEENQRAHRETQNHVEATRRQISVGNDETHGKIRDLRAWVLESWRKRTNHGSIDE